MASVPTEVEIHTSFPADKLFKAITKFHDLAPKAAPEIYKSITIIEGDGGVGTIQSIVYGDGVPYTTSKQKIDVVDVSNLSLSFTVFEGGMLSDYLESITHHIKISPSGDGGAVYKHTTVFNCKGETKPSEDVLNQTNEGYKKVFKAMEAYIAANVKMAAVRTEVEIHSSFPADKLFKAITKFHDLAPKAAPEIYKSITIIEGDGGVGTIQCIVYGDGFPYTTSKQKIDVVDVSNLSVSFTVFEGDVLSDYLESITHHIKISPSRDGGAVYKHTTVFNCKGETKPTEDVLNKTNEGYKKLFKAMEAYVVANGDAY